MATLSAAQTRSTEVAPNRLPHPPLAKTELEKRVFATIGEAVKAGEVYANVPAADGRMLRLLTESTGAKHVLEIDAFKEPRKTECGAKAFLV